MQSSKDLRELGDKISELLLKDKKFSNNQFLESQLLEATKDREEMGKELGE